MLSWSWLGSKGCLDCVPEHKNLILLIWSCFIKLIFGLSLGSVLCYVYGGIVDSIGMSLLPGERVVSRMSLGRKNSMYGSFKGAPRKQFRVFHAAAQSLFIRGLQLRIAITFTSELRFGCSWTLWKNL